MSLTDRLLGDRQRLAYIASQAADSRLNVELETEGMTLNIGPQHPATHGTLRIIARLDGEQVVWAEPSCGYMHRGYEKLAEVRTYPQVTSLVNRIDWLGSFANEVPFILAAEKLMGVEAPARSQHIRTILFELSRIANVSLFLGDLGVDVAIDQLPTPNSVITQAEFLRSHGCEMLVEEGRRAWSAAAQQPDLQTMLMPSRIREAEALLDPAGLGGFSVLEWRR